MQQLKHYYFSPLFKAGDFESTAQIEEKYRKLEPIKEIPIPKGFVVQKISPFELNI